MKKTIALVLFVLTCSLGTAFAQDDDYQQGNYQQDNYQQGHIKRVLLISVDGMHAVDFENCAKGISTVNNGEPYCPALGDSGEVDQHSVLMPINVPG